MRISRTLITLQWGHNVVVVEGTRWIAQSTPV